MAREWFYRDGLGVQRGPITDAQLARLLEVTDVRVWTEGLLAWEVASELLAGGLVAPLEEGRAQRGEHGEAPSRSFNRERRLDRGIHELLGLVRGVTADGLITDAEVHALEAWLRNNPDVREVWPASALADRLGRILADGRVDEEERGELLQLLRDTIGEGVDAAPSLPRATRLPLDAPAPEIVHAGRTFVFTGRFVYGTRSACEAAAMMRGGSVGNGISKKVNVLVIGELGNHDWIHSTHGRKIEKAVEYRAAGVPLVIVSEEHWARSLGTLAT